MSERTGDWLQTFTGISFWPLDPRPDEVDILDIAHSLSMQCRYGGHSRFFYSVAEHCVLLSHAVPADLAFSALMHDAAEAYLVDVPRPIKRFLGDYKTIESNLESVILPAFGLPYPTPALVMEYDSRILIDEREQLMAAPPRPWGDIASGPLGVRILGYPPMRAETIFLRRFHELKDAR